ncbi:helix-turn-helix domain-containing protein [Nonomuraea sp. NPDC049784]|uniref:TetR/AcrR family transcriptional regulator n=1 Tax=Nonomuraea sp. NPDC049784 TaxID=3154361 RepID=UPI0034034549
MLHDGRTPELRHVPRVEIHIPIIRTHIRFSHQLFATQGLKKTSLDELVAAPGIAKGSFYAFFDSKEELYKEVMIRRAPMHGKRLATALDRPALPGAPERLPRMTQPFGGAAPPNG